MGYGWYVDPLVAPLRNTWGQVWVFLPRAAAALLLMVVGLVLARAARTLLEMLGERLHADEHTSRAGLNEVLTRLGLGRSPTQIAGFSAYWLILVGFIVAAAQSLELEIATGFVERFGLFVARLIVAILIAFAGLALARLLARVVENAATANNVAGGATLARASSAMVIGFTTLMALEQLGLQYELVLDSIKIIVASAGLAGAIAFGLAGRRRAGEALERWLTRA